MAGGDSQGGAQPAQPPRDPSQLIRGSPVNPPPYSRGPCQPAASGAVALRAGAALYRGSPLPATAGAAPPDDASRVKGDSVGVEVVVAGGVELGGEIGAQGGQGPLPGGPAAEAASAPAASCRA